MSNRFLIGRRNFLFSCLSLATSLLCDGLAKAETLEDLKPFSFVFLSDCHLSTSLSDSYKLTKESQLFLQEAVKQINLLSPDFVIFGGDQVDSPGEEDATWQLFLDIVQSLDCPWYFVLGEADISGVYPIDKMHTYARDWRGRGLSNSRPYWSYDPSPGVHVIGLDTGLANSTAGYLSDEQLDWLKKDLAQQNAVLTLLVSHHPLLPPAPFDQGPKADQYLLPQASLVQDILQSFTKPILALSGHIHTSKIERRANVWYISSPSLDIYPCAFRHFQVTPQRVIMQTCQINFPALVKKAKSNLLNSSLAFDLTSGHPHNFVNQTTGSRLDQNASMTLSNGGEL